MQQLVLPSVINLTHQRLLEMLNKMRMHGRLHCPLDMSPSLRHLGQTVHTVGPVQHVPVLEPRERTYMPLMTPRHPLNPNLVGHTWCACCRLLTPWRALSPNMRTIFSMYFRCSEGTTARRRAFHTSPSAGINPLQ